MDGWKTILSFWALGLFSGAKLLLVSGRVNKLIYTYFIWLFEENGDWPTNKPQPTNNQEMEQQTTNLTEDH